ncbi:MFS transporter [Shouchella shacheensis]|uniref:MFS transporter n=1 Tax=Shouchella shacheensis TaxID=1649580 RepID=UPI00074033FE|nr:MFS transporter [Shouchella shacheensis]
MENDKIRVVLSFCKGAPYVAKIYLLFFGTTEFMTEINSLEAAFARGVLLLSDTSYGFLLSVFGAGIIIGSMINSLFAKQLAVNRLIGFGTTFAAVGYVLLYGSHHLYVAAAGVFLIGLAVTFANTGFLTFYQNHVPVKVMGRFGSIFSIIEAVCIVGLTTLIGLAAELASIRPVVLISSGGFVLLALFALKAVMGRERERYFSEGLYHDK